MIDFGLKPCPLCGGEAEVVRLTQNSKELTAVIKCSDCGLTLEWETEIVQRVSRSGQTIREEGMGPFEAWNRRQCNGVADCELCEVCSIKVYADQVAAQHDCNDCGAARGCDFVPTAGQHVRINCPLWQPQEGDE